MRRAALLLALGTAAISSCTSLNAIREPDPATALHEGVTALESQNYARARALLEPLYLEHWEDEVGRRAMLALIAAEVDTRNPDRRLWVAADLSARLLNVPDLEPWIVPVAEAYYLVALELGAHEQRLALGDSAGARLASRQANRVLPTGPEVTIPARITALESERSTLRRRVAELEEQLAASAEELRLTKVELERIKKTIKP
ncbi:MAG: hypothetical protein WEF86_04865 [Gemmatimonadota bacterium]